MVEQMKQQIHRQTERVTGRLCCNRQTGQQADGPSERQKKRRKSMDSQTDKLLCASHAYITDVPPLRQFNAFPVGIHIICSTLEYAQLRVLLQICLGKLNE